MTTNPPTRPAGDPIESTFTSGPHRLAGTYRPPARPGGPVALLISGSGPLDRDSNHRRSPVGVSGQLAAHLAAAGVGSFRYDKRGIGASSGEYLATGFLDNVADARAALEALVDHHGIAADAIAVVGHSEGALIAAELARPDGDRVTPGAVVLLAGAARPGEEVLRWQGAKVADSLPGPVRFLLRVLRKDLVTVQDKRIRQLRATTGDVARIQLVKVNARWFREFIDHDPTPALSETTVPVLAVTGAKDLQVPPDDVARIGELVQGPFDGHVIDDLSHLLRTEAGEPSVRTYRKQMRRPVDHALADLVTGWITDTVPRPGVPGPVDYQSASS